MSTTDNKTPGIFDKIKEDVFMEVIESAIPKIKPFLVPALEKLNEWFGNDEKIIVIKKFGDKKLKVVIFDNNVGEYEIKNSKDGKVFTSDPDSIVGVHDIESFMEKIITGDLTKMTGK